MKLIYIILKDIINLIKRETRIFLIMIITLVVAVSAVFFLYDIYKIVKEPDAEHFSKYKATNYKIRFSNSNSIDRKSEMIKNLFADNASPKISRICIQETEDSQETIIIGYYSRKKEDNFIEGRIFSKNEIDGCENVTIIAGSLLDYRNNLSYTGKLYNYKGKSFVIVGVVGWSPTLYIPYTTYLNNLYSISFMDITFDGKLKQKEQGLFLDSIKNIDKSAKIEFPPKIDVRAVEYLIIFMSLIFMCQGYAIINIISLFRFWAAQNMYRFSVYNLCGAKKVHQRLIITLEAVIISILSFAIGTILYLIIATFLKEANLYVSMNIVEVAVIFIIYIVSIIVSITPVSIKISRITPINRNV